MRLDPFIVVGTGRSGTSLVARLLHKKLNIYMGENFTPPDEANPEGSFEDIEFVYPNKKFLSGRINFKEWNNEIKTIVKKRQKLGQKWGFKDPTTTNILGFYLELFDNPGIIRCVRDRELVIKSFQRCYGWSEKKAEKLWWTREKVLDRLLKGRKHLVINFAKERLDESRVLADLAMFTRKPIKVYLAILNRGWLRKEISWNKLAAMQNTSGVRVVWEDPALTFGEPICSNRASICMRFLKTDCDFLMMMDNDILPYGNPMFFVHADKDIIGFPAKVRQTGRSLNWVAYHEVKNYGYVPVDFGKLPNKEADLLPVDVVGTGCILIKRRVIKKLMNKAPFLVEFDKYGINRYGTDFAFCRRAKKAGFEIFTAPNCICEHIKELGFLDNLGHDDSDYRDDIAGKYNIPWGDYAISQKDWHFIREIVQEVKPKKILEFGAGLSSCLMSEFAEVLSFEEDEKYAKDLKKKLTDKNKLKIRIWDGINLNGKLGKERRFDLAFVDGPRGQNGGGIGRQHSMRIASEHADKIIVHDARREDEWSAQEKYLKGKFKLKKINGYHQVCCHYWERMK